MFAMKIKERKMVVLLGAMKKNDTASFDYFLTLQYVVLGTNILQIYVHQNFLAPNLHLDLPGAKIFHRKFFNFSTCFARVG